MGKTRKLMTEFIDVIPDSKLEGGIQSDIIYRDRNFRLDNQSTTAVKENQPLCLNIQMQVNYKPKATSLKDVAPFTVAGVLVPVAEDWSAEKIKVALKKDCCDIGDKTGYW